MSMGQAFSLQPVETKAIYRPLGLPGVELWIVTGSTRLWTVYHRTYTLVAADPTASEWRYRRRSYATTSRSTMLLEPGEAHTITKKLVPANFQALFVEPQTLAHFFEGRAPLSHPHFRVGQVDDDELVEQLRRLGLSIATPGTDALELEELFQRCICTAFRKAGESALPPPPRASGCEREVRLARELIEERYPHGASLTLDELAQAARMSKCYLAQVFADKMGVPPHRYLKIVRVGRALEFIRQGVSLSEVARRAGFADQAHLTREMKSQMGFTPGQLRQACGHHR